MVWLKNPEQARAIYDGTRKAFTVIPFLIAPVTFVIDAGFGRFSPASSKLLVDGIKSWIFMELVSPITFVSTFLQDPLSPSFPTSALNIPSSLTPSALLALLYLIHYTNRSLVSPLRTPSRSKSHITVPMFAVGFNLLNGFLMGAYLASPSAENHLTGAFSRRRFWAGVSLWATGFASNVLHDEILLNIRRKAKGKAKESGGKEHYAIPQGYGYNLISYPNYFSEWVEWVGFALAASPAPSLASTSAFLETISPPWIFVLSEVLLMLPRAWRGHRWYHSKFPDYPKQRKAVIPFLF
ncbi:hypothetical protein PUNSTDRAFT_145142 [Punctularia strigosozonata HHB-11173 SS5]|uniref:uncharacterized protein n=1 Tax=Punctularia strigosozonata (strain HHB-11173) TaxID=741275 RepID=UPI0004417CDD|nr:uncharacterized protein PUNSTDRAFT_145142 [Punctularia strigosozonata HHB-11173 SS5]EIN06580.1 hypothetical protein PUNSTDRAFT_145142 [Punctularia strigosozonata HHB-11173 SS5]